MPIEENEKKLAELILYISQKCAHDPDFGATKLNKILYFSDFFAFGNWGESITGAEYQNLRRGPAPRRLLPVRDQLKSDGALVIQPVYLLSGFVQHRTVNLREPDLKDFKAREIALVDHVIDQLSGLSAIQTSELSHQYVGWKATREYETIPYETIFFSDAPPTESDIRRAKEIMAEEELEVA